MILSEAIQSLMTLQAKLAAYGHAMGLLFYDGATTAPKGTAANRGQTMSILSEEGYKKGRILAKRYQIRPLFLCYLLDATFSQTFLPVPCGLQGVG